MCLVFGNTIDIALNSVVQTTPARTVGALSDMSHKAVDRGYEVNSGGAGLTKQHVSAGTV